MPQRTGPRWTLGARLHARSHSVVHSKRVTGLVLCVAGRLACFPTARSLPVSCHAPQDPSGLGYVLPTALDCEAADPTLQPSPTALASSAATPPNGGPSAAAQPALLPLPQQPGSGWGTVILLPAAPRLLPNGAADGSGTVASAGAGAGGAASWPSLAAGLLAEVRPGLLLFLRRVRRLEVYDDMGGVRHTLERVDKEGGAVVEVRDV